ncbi:MAG TPA: hypothetical protein VHZ32_16835 [Rhizomicrobium sp.]|nr:hypothetical protein [Rhizomicrobium sp.]
MRAVIALLWFLTAFVAGAGLYAATRPGPVIHALAVKLQGDGLFTRCRQVGACGKPVPPAPGPIPALPADMDRA